MSYKVIHYFTDLQDFNHPYKVGDSFPRLGLKVSEDRLKLIDFGTCRQQGKQQENITEQRNQRNSCKHKIIQESHKRCLLSDRILPADVSDRSHPAWKD